MSFYSDIKENTARPLIKKFGAKGEFHKNTAGTYDAALAAKPITTKKHKNQYFLMEDLSYSDLQNSKYQLSEKKLTVILPVVPSTADEVLLNKVLYTVNAIHELGPGGETVFNTLYVSKV